MSFRGPGAEARRFSRKIEGLRGDIKSIEQEMMASKAEIHEVGMAVARGLREAKKAKSELDRGATCGSSSRSRRSTRTAACSSST